MDINFLILIILIALAILDLTVGVANDAVNFLNSAIGANAAKLKTIMIVAGLGVLAGVLMSSGMMEVARKGIFNPEFFYMPELMVIFVAVMFQDILLLDTFNTFGLPTSTTVSIVFGLFGSGVAMSIIKISKTTGDYNEIFQYMNTDKVLTIIGAILLSIVMAFVVGLFVQWITRLIFSFDFKTRFRKYGPYWGGVALTAITFFILLKGTKGASFMTEDVTSYIKNNIYEIALYSFVVWTIILFVIIRFTKFNALKLIVLIGTFSLAMAFAANDLVNFIGAPVAGLTAYTKAHLTSDPTMADMSVLQQKIPANPLYLVVAGLVMVATLFLSKKARSVATTTIALGRQDEGYERFESNAVARSIVRIVYSLFTTVRKVIPNSLVRFVSSRFDTSKFSPEVDENGNTPSFDLLRAAVILLVASVLISFATSYKLPLSTTYVTFIVAMAAALPDKAWGRDSAAYRVSGVLTVVGGWFFTALSASVVAMIICFVIYYGEIWGLIGVTGLVGYSVYNSTRYHKRKEAEHKLAEEKVQKEIQNKESANKKALSDVGEYMETIADIFVLANTGLYNESVKMLKKSKKYSDRLEKDVQIINSDIIKIVDKFDNEDSEFSNLAVRMTVSLQDMSDKLYHSVSQNYKYVDNNHTPLNEDEKDLIIELNNEFLQFTKELKTSLINLDFSKYEEIKNDYQQISKKSSKSYKKQLKRVKKQKTSVRKSIIILNLISDFELQSELMFKVYEFAKLTRTHV